MNTLDEADFWGHVKDAALRKLTFSFMQAWEAAGAQPEGAAQESSVLQQCGGVGEDAFVRVAIAVPGVTSSMNVHALFESLAQGNSILTLEKWDRFLTSMQLKRQQLEKQTTICRSQLSLALGERILAEGSASMVREVPPGTNPSPFQLRRNTHGHLTLTTSALYFQNDSIWGQGKVLRLDLCGDLHQEVQAFRVGPLGTHIFDRGLCVSSRVQDEPWVLDFLEYRGDGQRDMWLAMIGEVLAMHNFVREYSPLTSTHDKSRLDQATKLAAQGLSTVQVLQGLTGAPPSHPEKLLAYLWASTVPQGRTVEQALAAVIWAPAPPASPTFSSSSSSSSSSLSSSSLSSSTMTNVADAVPSSTSATSTAPFSYLSLALSASSSFRFGKSRTLSPAGRLVEGDQSMPPAIKASKKVLACKHSFNAYLLQEKGGGKSEVECHSEELKMNQSQVSVPKSNQASQKSTPLASLASSIGVAVSHTLVAGGRSKLEEAVRESRAREVRAEKAQATIEGALISGIPKNVQLLQELVRPAVVVAGFLGHACRWEEPAVTLITVAAILYIVNTSLLAQLPALVLLALILTALLLRFTRTGPEKEPLLLRLRPQKSTMAKLVGLKNGLDKGQAALQTVNIFLLKCRTLLYSDMPQETDRVLLALTCVAAGLALVTWLVPFRMLVNLLVAHLFTCQLAFRKPRRGSSSMARRLRDWWHTIQVAPIKIVVGGKDVTPTGKVPSSESAFEGQLEKVTGIAVELPSGEGAPMRVVLPMEEDSGKRAAGVAPAGGPSGLPCDDTSAPEGSRNPAEVGEAFAADEGQISDSMLEYTRSMKIIDKWIDDEGRY